MNSSPTFALSEEHQSVRAPVRAICDAKIAPFAAEVERYTKPRKPPASDTPPPTNCATRSRLKDVQCGQGGFQTVQWGGQCDRRLSAVGAGGRGGEVVAGGVEPVPVQAIGLDPGDCCEFCQRRPLTLNLLAGKAIAVCGRGERSRQLRMDTGRVVTPRGAGSRDILGIDCNAFDQQRERGEAAHPDRRGEAFGEGRGLPPSVNQTGGSPDACGSSGVDDPPLQHLDDLRVAVAVTTRPQICGVSRSQASTSDGAAWPPAASGARTISSS